MERPSGVRRSTVFVAVFAAGLILAAGIWLLRWAPSRGAVDLSRLSDVGQAFGVVSAAISAVAVVAVALSLRIQRRQAGIAQLEAVLTLRTDLLRFAIEQPRYLPIWGYGESGPSARETAYCSMVFVYLKMAFSLGLLTEFELREYCRLVFVHEPVVQFWTNAKRVYLLDKTNPGATFATIVDAEFEATHGVTTVDHAARCGQRRRRLLLALGATAAVAAGVMSVRLTNGRRRSADRPR
jgi:hypothetical protein